MLNHPIAKAIFAALDVTCLLAALFLITSGQLTPVLFAAPLLFAAFTVFFGNLYLNLFQDELEEWEKHDDKAREHQPIPVHK